jgi:hypothetical protein
MKSLIKTLLRENIQMLQEEKFNDLYAFLDQNPKKMTIGSAYYVADLNSSMNKFMLDDEGNKIPNPMYGKLYKHTRFMFRWQDTYGRAVERKNPEHQMGQRSGSFEKVEGYDVLERKGDALYLPIMPTGSQAEYSVMEGGKMVPIGKEEVYKYLRPSKPSSSGSGVDFRLLMVGKIAKLTGGGNVWVNPDFGSSYMGAGSLDESKFWKFSPNKWEFGDNEE